MKSQSLSMDISRVEAKYTRIEGKQFETPDKIEGNRPKWAITGEFIAIYPVDLLTPQA